MDSMDVIGREVEKLIEYVDTGTTDSAEQPFEVPVERYTDPARFDREMKAIFHKLPLLAALSAEIPDPGDYKALEMLGKPILITRKSDGSAAAMLNVCTHRGMKLKPEGCGQAKRFSCPYHGWTFGNDGKLIGVADPAKFGAIDKSQRNLTQLPCVEAAGIIWIGLTAGGTIDVEGGIGGMLDDLKRFELDKWHYFGSRRIHGPNWKIAYDGYLEGYHFAAAHPETIHPRTFSNVMNFTAFGPHLRVGFPRIDIKEQLKDVPRDEWAANENTGYDFVRTVFPNVSIFFAPELTQVAQLVPGPTPDKNHTNLIFIRRDPPRDDADQAAVFEMIDFLEDVVQREDYGVGLQVQQGLESGALKSVIFGKNERGNQYFHRYVDYYLDGAKGPPPVL
jgi:phenylpropionate dioxygenase-like ring-hydroxylating dioxygenase large terminal subunit